MRKHELETIKDMLIPPMTYQTVPIPVKLSKENHMVDGVIVGHKNTNASSIDVKQEYKETSMDIFHVHVRNNFIDSRNVDFVLTLDAETKKVNTLPSKVLKETRERYMKESNLLGYEGLKKETLETLFKTSAQGGSVFIPKGTVIACIIE